MNPRVNPVVGESEAVELEGITKAVLAGSNQDLANSETLPPVSYTSEAFFDAEMEKIFRTDWVAVGHIAQIPNVGDYVTIDILNELLVIVRGPDRIRVMSRVCLHRWAPVASGEGNTKLFSCPFHRWAYGLDGQLKAAPHMEQAEGFNAKDCKLPEVRSEIWHGTIYINLSGDAEPLKDRLSDLDETFARYGMDKLVLAFSYKYECNFNWKIAVETFMECYHHIGAHSKTAEPHSPGRFSFGGDGGKGWTVCYAPWRPDLPISEKPVSGLPMFEGLSDEVLRNGGLYVVYPQQLINTNADRIHWTTIIPISVNKCIWFRQVLVKPEALDLPNYQEIIDNIRETGMAIFMEDIEVNDMQQIGAKSSLATVGRLSHLEKTVWQFANYVRGRMRD